MLGKRRVKVSIKEIISDIRSGLTNAELIEKYGLYSAKTLQSIFRKLLDAAAIDRAELGDRFIEPVCEGLTAGPGKEYKPRELPRRKPFGKLTIHDLHDLTEEYTVADVSEHGMKVCGLECCVGQKKDFLIRSDRLDEVKPFSFSANCKWVDRSVCGFEVTDIDPRSLMEFRKLISLFTFEE